MLSTANHLTPLLWFLQVVSAGIDPIHHPVPLVTPEQKAGISSALFAWLKLPIHFIWSQCSFWHDQSPSAFWVPAARSCARHCCSLLVLPSFSHHLFSMINKINAVFSLALFQWSVTRHWPWPASPFICCSSCCRQAGSEPSGLLPSASNILVLCFNPVCCCWPKVLSVSGILFCYFLPQSFSQRFLILPNCSPFVYLLTAPEQSRWRCLWSPSLHWRHYPGVSVVSQQLYPVLTAWWWVIRRLSPKFYPFPGKWHKINGFCFSKICSLCSCFVLLTFPEGASWGGQCPPGLWRGSNFRNCNEAGDNWGTDGNFLRVLEHRRVDAPGDAIVIIIG